MKKIVSCILVLVMTFLYTEIDIAAYCAVNPVHEAADNALNSDDVFKGRAEINDKLEKENKELFTGEIDQLDTKDVIKMTVSQVLTSGITEEGDEFFA